MSTVKMAAVHEALDKIAMENKLIFVALVIDDAGKQTATLVIGDLPSSGMAASLDDDLLSAHKELLAAAIVMFHRDLTALNRPGTKITTRLRVQPKG